jgi:glucose/arabinose dehydrogenase
MHNPVSAAARAVVIGSLAVAGALIGPLAARAQTPPPPDPVLDDAGLAVSTVVSGLVQPIAMAFLGPNDFLVTEKASGQVKRVTNGVVTGVVLDLPVNSNSERGLLGMALHPDFPGTPYVYLYNTETTTGADSTLVEQTTILGNRVDRFVWDGSTLTYDLNIIRLRAFQNDLNNVLDPANPLPVLRGNHDGGVLAFGPDGKLYVIVGDLGRRGYTQNNLDGPAPDDAFGGPEPDDEHLSGVILRLNDDGSTPRDNPFYRVVRRGDCDGQCPSPLDGLSTEALRNVERMFAFGVRNSFGMTFDPKRGHLWTTENGGAAFDEINYVPPGFNGGWIQAMGPLSRVHEFKQIETAAGVNSTTGAPAGLQQVRFPPSRIADSAQEAAARMFGVPRSRVVDPQFSWKQVVPPAALGFIDGGGLGDQYEGDLIVGSAVARSTNPGHLYRFRLNQRRTAFVFDDPLLQDKVADNLVRDDFTTEQAEIMFGRNFGTVTHITTGPDRALYLVSPSSGTVRKIAKR